MSVLFYHHPTDAFTSSIAAGIIEYATATSESDPDSLGSARHLRTCEQLADHVRDLPLDDVRLQQLLVVSPSSDHFDLSVGRGRDFIQLIGQDRPYEGDSDQALTEFVIACGFEAAPPPGESKLVRELQARQAEDHLAATQRESALQADLDERDRVLAELTQEASDLRGENRRLRDDGGGEAETLSRRVAQLEGELDQANRRAAAAESKLGRRTAKTSKTRKVAA